MIAVLQVLVGATGLLDAYALVWILFFSPPPAVLGLALEQVAGINAVVFALLGTYGVWQLGRSAQALEDRLSEAEATLRAHTALHTRHVSTFVNHKQAIEFLRDRVLPRHPGAN